MEELQIKVGIKSKTDGLETCSESSFGAMTRGSPLLALSRRLAIPVLDICGSATLSPFWRSTCVQGFLVGSRLPLPRPLGFEGIGAVSSAQQNCSFQACAHPSIPPSIHTYICKSRVYARPHWCLGAAWYSFMRKPLFRNAFAPCRPQYKPHLPLFGCLIRFS